jgi:ATP-dependent helicase/nuclease subunit B
MGRGARYVDLARRLDLPVKVESAARPQPRPPTALQPLRLSVTEVETLVRDPYAIYAKHVLALEPLDPLAPALDARLLGSLIHAVLDEAARRAEIDGPDYAGHFLRAAATALDAEGLPPRLRAFLDARFAGLASSYAEFERARRPDIDAVLTEQSGSLPLALADGATFTLSARADRIEKRVDGAYGILDFKTGAMPGKKEVAAGYAPQLTLEAAMVAGGGFRFAPAHARIASLCHVKLASDGGPAEVRDLATGSSKSPPLDLDAKPAEHLARLVAYLDELRSGRRAFVSRRYPRKVRDDAPTNHLARAQEWMREMAEAT